MNPRRIARTRLRTQGLTRPSFESPEAVVRFLGAVQAQEYALAKWSLGQRSGAQDGAVEIAHADGRILRTHVLRPTWHFVLPDDIRWLLELTGPPVRRTLASYDRRLELDDALYATTRDVITRALEGGLHCTRAELADALERAGIAARGQRLAHIVAHSELTGDICSGAPRGTRQTYALLAERAPNARTLGRDEALCEIAHRYFTSHGPATIIDFRWWSGLRAADARTAVALAGDALDSFDADGRTYIHAAELQTAPASRTAHLLQAYDETIVAYTESRDVLAPDGFDILRNLGQAPFTHAILRDGRFLGHWRVVRKARSLRVETQLAVAPGPAQRRALQAAVAAYGRFLGAKVDLGLTGSR